jgi:transketolase
MTYQERLAEITLADKRYVVMTAENRASIKSIPESLGDRFIDTGINEQALIGAAAGLALRGRIPVVHALSAFMTMRAFEFIRTDIGLAGLPVKLAGSVAGFLSEANGPTHQALEDISLMRGIPKMQIFCPADEEELVIGLKDILESPFPCYIRLNHLKPPITHSPQFRLGSAEVISDGKDISIIVYGILLKEAFEAKKVLEEKGRSVRLINLRTLVPIDEQVVRAAASETSLVVTLEDHFLTGGLYSIVSELLIRERIAGKVLPLALDNHWFRPALMPQVLEYEGFTGRQIADRVLKSLNGGTIHA